MNETRARPAWSFYWNGMLCAETRDEIAERMREILDEEYFTLVTCNSYSTKTDNFSSVDVYPSQWLTGPIGDYSNVGVPGIAWTIPRLSMGVHTTAETQAKAREDRPHGYVHFSFERDRIEIDHYAPAGYRLLWILAVERHDRDAGGSDE